MPGRARKIADTFNYLYAHRGQTVGKTCVAELVKKHHEEILRLRQQLKHRKPRKVQKNLIWALDLTFLPGPQGPRPVFGLVDHGTRVCLSLTALRDRSAIGILRHLLDALERFGKPAILRTDNEPIFTSRLFRFTLWLLGIRHQRTAPHCPWQNGRIERLFLTFKQKLLDWFEEAGVPDDLDEDLATVRAWYNHLRPHQHLGGLTPAAAWTGKKASGRGEPRYLSAWNGRLTGFLFPT
ncbi:MAG: integrase core domain-containing protein [Thermoanaerobaculia bacterium]